MAVIPQLGRYRYIAELGSGGMSTVVLAEDTVLGRKVALKHVHGTGDVRRVTRLRREALIGASLSHPNLVSIYDIASLEDRDVIVMEYVEGETLRDALKRSPRPPVPRVLEILDGVASALDAIHQQRIVHRDVKPGNILLGSSGDIKLADLGIAVAPDRTKITTDGAILGTFSYMAPEQLAGDTATPSVDIYALSAVAFEALSGRRARTESNPVSLAHAIATQPPPDLRDAWRDGPAAAAELLRRGMAREPSKRPRTAGELIGRLRAALEPQATAPIPPAARTMARRPQRPARATRPRPSPRPRPAPRVEHKSSHRRGLLPIAALVLALGGLGAVIAVGSGGGQPSSHAAAKHGTRTSGTRSHAGARRATPGSGGSSVHQSSGTSTPSTSTPPAASSTAGGSAAAAPTGGAGSPVTATESFYHLAAAHRYSSAWALADPAFRNQLGGYPSFESGQQGDRSIAFDSARVVSQSPSAATVAVRTTSVRTDGTQHCAGTVDLVRGGSAGWLLHQIHINC